MMNRFAKYLAAFGAALALGAGGATVAAASGHHHSHRSLIAMKADARNDLLPGEQGEVQNGQTETQSGEQGETQNGEQAEANQSGEQGETQNGEQAEANQGGEQGEPAPVGSGTQNDHQG